MKTRARHTIVRYRRSNISTQFSRGHSLRTNLAPRLDVQRQSRSIINATLEGVDDYRSLGRAVFALLEFPSRRSLSLLHPRPIPIKDLSTARSNKVCFAKWKRRDTVSNVIYKPSRVSLSFESTIERRKRKFPSTIYRRGPSGIKFWAGRVDLVSFHKFYVLSRFHVQSACARYHYRRGRDKRWWWFVPTVFQFLRDLVLIMLLITGDPHFILSVLAPVERIENCHWGRVQRISRLMRLGIEWARG